MFFFAGKHSTLVVYTTPTLLPEAYGMLAGLRLLLQACKLWKMNYLVTSWWFRFGKHVNLFQLLHKSMGSKKSVGTERVESSANPNLNTSSHRQAARRRQGLQDQVVRH